MKMENLKFTSSFFNDDKYFLPTEKLCVCHVGHGTLLNILSSIKTRDNLNINQTDFVDQGK